MKHRNRTAIAIALVTIAMAATDSRAQTIYTPYTFVTIAGNNGFGSTDGTNDVARFAYANGAAVDGAGNIYVADTFNDTIRKMTQVGTNWVVTTLAGRAGVVGSADGTGSAARFDNPTGVAVDRVGNVYVADSINNTVRKVAPAGSNWVVTTLAGLAGIAGSADGTNGDARFSIPYDVAVDVSGNVYVADSGNCTIRMLSQAGTNWVVTTLAGQPGNYGSADGAGSAASFGAPNGLAMDASGNLYVADEPNSTIRKVALVGTEWLVTTLAGQAGVVGSTDGSDTSALFGYPSGVAVDASGNVYVADTYNCTIRKMTLAGADWQVTTLAGQAGIFGSTDGASTNALFDYPYGVAVDSAGNVYVADSSDNEIRKITPAAVVTTLAGTPSGSPGSSDGDGSDARFSEVLGIALDRVGNLYLADAGNNTIRKVARIGTNWVVTTLAGQPGISGSTDGTNGDALFNSPTDLAADSVGNLYVADAGNNTIRMMTPVGANWAVTTLAGQAGQRGGNDGVGIAALFRYPTGIAVDANGNVYVADQGNGTIREVSQAGTNWVVTTLAGVPLLYGSVDGTNSYAEFDDPDAIKVDSATNLYVTDGRNNNIRKLTPVGTNWVVTTLAGEAGTAGATDGTGSAARFSYPDGLALDSAGNIYVGDAFNSIIRKVTPVGTNWVVTTVAGVPPSLGGADGTGPNALFYWPAGVAVDSAGDLFASDRYNYTIREGFPANSVSAPVLGLPNSSDGQFQFDVTGIPGLPVDIESSTNLLQWEWLGTYALDDGGVSHLAQPPSSAGQQFYRGRVH